MLGTRFSGHKTRESKRLANFFDAVAVLVRGSWWGSTHFTLASATDNGARAAYRGVS
jgi:hypothetical protein